MKRGLTLGKFAPLHRGHQLVIETALDEMDEVVVIVYDSPEVTSIPLSVRVNWIRRLYPTVRIVEAWAGPSAVGYSPELMRAHERYVIDTLGVSGITHFYSSEPYGEHMSAALGAIDRQVDPDRRHVPVSGRAIRQEPFQYRDALASIVYRDLVVNVAILGAPSTGKTTLARRLAEVHQTNWMPEYGREYWTQHQRDRRLTPVQLVEIAEGHIAREDDLLGFANRVMFTDTNAITTATFARQYHGQCATRLEELANDAARRYDLVFVCADDIPYEDTWDRSGPLNRTVFQRQVLADLRVRKIPYFMVRGSVDERVSQVSGVLGRFCKYMNLAELLEDAPR